MTTLDDLADPAPPRSAADWTADGVVYYPGLIPDDLIDAYRDAWCAGNGYRARTAATDVWTERPSADPWGLEVLEAESPGGWNEACPYMHVPDLLDLCTYPPLAAALEALLGQPAGLHLNLTGWVSTRRSWHQDTYLNPYNVGDSYAAVWIALGDIHPDSGVFQYVPGSHLWHRLTRDRISAHVDINDPAWPEHTEALLTPLVEAEIERRDATVIDYVPNRGDVLIWHPRLYHQGSVPKVDGAYRPAAIAHYSGIQMRPDMPVPVQHMDAGWYFPIATSPPTASDERRAMA